ncbi:Disco-interacting protein 2 homolog C [Strongyloides ratti]|uniref:Disco-interacting protein 2 homolog C n=1 Tax=Strongyloides ratti TaxID=34506 RepID=A0A090LK66_STRRB|nr:Disco-interacting protein 2 homolog C [Strongyloides ratti]CEF68538.1 Disco-interacting protein 2 homolog C [Strongyloides ratti]
MPQEEIDLGVLPDDVLIKLKQLELELAEGDITQKGFDKKKLLLIGPYIQAQLNQDHKISSTPQTRAKRRNQRRLTREESRYKSEIRHESVQAALRQWNNCDSERTNNKNTEISISPINLINKKKEDQQIYENSCIVVNQESEENNLFDIEKPTTKKCKDKIKESNKNTDTFTLDKIITISNINKEENSITDEIELEIDNNSLKTSTPTVLQQLIANSIADEMEPGSNNLVNFLKSPGTFSSNTTNTTSSNDSCTINSRSQSKINVYQNFNIKESNVDGESLSSINISEPNNSSCQEVNNSYHTNDSRNSTKSLELENNSLPMKPLKVSVKIQALLESLQVDYIMFILATSTIIPTHKMNNDNKKYEKNNNTSMMCQSLNQNVWSSSSNSFNDIKDNDTKKINELLSIRGRYEIKNKSSSRSKSNTIIETSVSNSLKQRRFIYQTAHNPPPSLYNNNNNSYNLKTKYSSQTTINGKIQSSFTRNLPLSYDISQVITIFDPKKIEEQRKKKYKSFNDSSIIMYPKNNPNAGFIFVHNELKSFTKTKMITVGGRNVRSIRIADLPNIDKMHSNLILKKYHFLQRPRSKPLHEYYNDDDAELEAMAKIVDPNAPRPEGSYIQPIRGEFPISSPSTIPTPQSSNSNSNSTNNLNSILNNFPRSIESALHRYGTTSPKNLCGILLDNNGKMLQSLSYSKLYSRANKIAYTLLTKTITSNCVIGHSQNQSSISKENLRQCICKPGDRVALIFSNNEPLSFITAFYGCIIGGLIPVPIEVPSSKKDAGIQQIGFLLGSCGVKTALTTENCFKSLPKKCSTTSSQGTNLHPSDMIDLKSWPKLTWVMSEYVSKPGKEWNICGRNINDESIGYIEHSTDRKGYVKGVAITRNSIISHSKSITAAMNYKEGETIICVLDFKREVGLWTSILTSLFNGMRVAFVPYNLMKSNPSCWMIAATKLNASHVVLKSRDLHWSLLASKDQKDINLNNIKSIIIADGANPWSLSSCDQFCSIFQKRGLRPEVLCPCAGSSESGLIAIRRPFVMEYSSDTGSSSVSSSTPSGRGVLSMEALSHSVVRVDKETSLTSLTLQDAGQIIPGGILVVVKVSGIPKICKADEIGEICISSPSTGSFYWGLDGISSGTFKVEPLGPDERPIGNLTYVRSGLIGFLGPDGLVFVIGNKSTMMNVSGRSHSADDIIATVLAVEPMKFIYRGRIAVFSINVLRDERICIVAEQKPDVQEEEAFNWITKVLQAVDNIHQVGIYCLALVPANHLPKTPLGGIHVSETRQRFLDCTLHPTTLLMCPHNCVLNLPKPREPQQSEVGPAAMFVGNIVQGVRIAGAQGRELQHSSDDNKLLIDILKDLATTSPDHILYTLINSKGIEVESLSCGQLYKKAEKIGLLLLEKGHLNEGDHVALIFPPGIDLITAFYGCLIANLIPVCIRPPHQSNLQSTLPTVRLMVDISKSVAILTSSNIGKLLKSKEAAHRIDTKAWPNIFDIEDSSSFTKKKNIFSTGKRGPNDICYLDFNVSTTGQLAGIIINNSSVIMKCKSLKVACELYKSRHVALSLDPYCGLGFELFVLSSVYSGYHSIIIPPQEVEINPSLFLSVVSQHKVRDVFCSYGVMELCVKELAPQIDSLKEKGIYLSCVRTCVAVAEERPRVALCTAFAKLFAPLGLQSRAISTSFGCRVNTGICMQGSSSPDPATVYVDARALRNDRVSLVEKGSPHSVPLMESGKLLPGVKVVIANPETKGQCADSHLGEIWVSSPFNANGYFSIFGEEATLHTDHFNAKLKTGDTKTVFARTGYLGFLKQTSSITANGELHDAVFVVGSLDETMILRGMRYHPVDIEVTVVKTHRKIIESAAFKWTNRLVIVAEVEGDEAEALDLVPAITSSILEEHHLIVGVVVLIDPGMIPINTRGEKQRMHLRDSFLREELDPIYIAYNM